MRFIPTDLRRSISSLRWNLNWHSLTQSGWPALIGLMAAACGLAMLVIAWHYDRETTRIRLDEATNFVAESSSPGGARQFARATEATFTIPDDGSHIDDLSRLFKLAKAKGVQIGTVEYRLEQQASLQILVRTLDIRIHEDYPKLKSFVADLLAAIPHASLQEIRVERKDAASPQGQILLKLAFVYRAATPASGLTKAQP